jgi:hypothetical protein
MTSRISARHLLRPFLTTLTALAVGVAPASATIRVVTVNAPGVNVGATGVAGVSKVSLGNMGLTGGAGLTNTSLSGTLSNIRVRGVTVAPQPDVTVAAQQYPELADKATVADLAVEARARAATDSLSRIDQDRSRDDRVTVTGNSSGEQAAGRGEDAENIGIDGNASAGANALNTGLIAMGATGAPGMRETIGAAFDGSGLLKQDVTVADAPVSGEELFGRENRVEVPSEEAARLTGLADQVAQWRGVRATQGENALSEEQAAVLRGIDDMARAVALGNTNPAILQMSADVVENMDIAKLRRFSELAWQFMDTEVEGKSTPFARVGNTEHVSQQLIDPLEADGEHLAAAFKGERQSTAHFSEMVKALQMATDTGKQQNPDDLKAALGHFNPQSPVWYINNFILPHEYASIIWVEKFGKQAGFSDKEILAFQRLIANHNFGPDLTNPVNAQMRDHWWAKNFREQMIPMMAAMGIDVKSTFRADETGTLQYHNTQGHPLSMILSVYDRAIAVPANGNGLATWKKYGTQDFNGKKGRLKGIRESNAQAGAGSLLKAEPEGAADEDGRRGPIFEFDGPSLVRAMESTADWAEQHIESLWGSLYATLPENSPIRQQYPTPQDFRMYPPYLKHRKSIGALNVALRLAKADNPEGPTSRADIVPKDGVAYYQVRNGAMEGVYRVTLERTGSGAFDQRSTDYGYQARLEVNTRDGWAVPTGEYFGNGGLAVIGDDPVALYTDLIRTSEEVYQASLKP